MDTKIIMVTSGKGGTGKSTVASHLAGALAAGGKTLLVELDSGLRSVDIITGVYGKTVYDIGDVLSGQCEGSRAVVESPGYPGLFVLSAPVSGGTIRPQALEVFCRKMAPHFRWIVLDTAAGMEMPFEAAAGVAGTAVLVLQADPVCLRDGRIVSDTLYNEKGIRDIRLVVNRLVPKNMLAMGIRDLDVCIDTVCARLLGVLPESIEILQAGAAGRPLRADSPEREVFRRMAARLQGDDLPLLLDSY